MFPTAESSGTAGRLPEVSAGSARTHGLRPYRPARPEAADLVRGGGDARGVGDVQDEQPGAAADLLRGAFSARGVAGADVHGEAASGELACDLLADALVGAGDQCN
jgi:hypothetical protein